MFREMIEQLNINIKTAAAESPWPDELVKEKYGVAGNMLEKVISDVRCSLKVVFAWCISAKNSLLNSYG